MLGSRSSARPVGAAAGQPAEVDAELDAAPAGAAQHGGGQRNLVRAQHCLTWVAVAQPHLGRKYEL